MKVRELSTSSKRPAGQQLGEAAAVLAGEEPVVGRPDHEGGPLEARDALGGAAHMAAIRRPQEAAEVAAHAGFVRTAVR